MSAQRGIRAEEHMPRIPTHFVILRKNIGRLAAPPDPNLQEIGRILKDNAAYAYLGAVGPALGDFIPSDPPPPGPALPSTNFYPAIWKQVFGVVGGDGTPGNPGLRTILGK